VLSQSLFHLSTPGSNVGQDCDFSSYVEINPSETWFGIDKNISSGFGASVMSDNYVAEKGSVFGFEPRWV